jgi:hypothetical protein
MLADNAQAVGGKLYILGAGWNWTVPGMPGAVAGIVTVPWNETNRKHVLTFNLVDDSGSAVRVPTPQGTQEPLTIRTEFEVGRPPGVRPGSSFSHPIAINYLALPLQAGRSYEWRWSVNEKSRDDWRLAFEVRQVPIQPQAAPPT